MIHIRAILIRVKVEAGDEVKKGSSQMTEHTQKNTLSDSGI